MSKNQSGTIVVRDSVNIEPIVEKLTAVERTFVHEREHRFEGMPSKFRILPESRQRHDLAASVRELTAVTGHPAAGAAAQFWRFRTGNYLLPTDWRPEMPEDVLHILMLTTSDVDALAISQESGATTHDMLAGRLITVRQPCRFWLGPVIAQEVYLAVSGLNAAAGGGGLA